jgi:hypothetical protein
MAGVSHIATSFSASGRRRLSLDAVSVMDLELGAMPYIGALRASVSAENSSVRTVPTRRFHLYVCMHACMYVCMHMMRR